MRGRDLLVIKEKPKKKRKKKKKRAKVFCVYRVINKDFN